VALPRCAGAGGVGAHLGADTRRPPISDATTSVPAVMLTKRELGREKRTTPLRLALATSSLAAHAPGAWVRAPRSPTLTFFPLLPCAVAAAAACSAVQCHVRALVHGLARPARRTGTMLCRIGPR